MNIFISYNRQTEAITKALVEDVETLGHTAWFDQELSGGQVWWDQILSMIRRCDLFVFVLDPAALNSVACKREYDYAADLRKPILPILVSEGVSTNLLPPSLSQIEFVDYRNQDRTAALRLGRAFSAVPPPAALPDPLPVPPQAPLSYLGSLAAKLETTSLLTYEEQSALVFDLKKGLRNPQTADDTRTLLETFRKRRDLFAGIAEEIDELFEGLRETSSARERQATKVQTMPPELAMLRDAWQRVATYEANSSRLQKAFKNIQFWILMLPLIAVFLVVFEKQGLELVRRQQVKALTEHSQPAERTKPYQGLENALGWLRYPLIVIPIVTSILLAYYMQFRPANRWILLRGTAEAIRREIYRYRSRTGDYSKDRLTTNSRDDVFHDRLEPVRRLMQTEANQGALRPYRGPLPTFVQKDDDGFSFLTPERYIELRLEDQLNYYSNKTPKLETQIKQMQVAILAAGGAGTLLAAVGAELWVALTTALATALTTSLASRQLGKTLVCYNQSAADLTNVRDWWIKLSPAAKRNPKNIDQLVEVTEKVLEAELSGWAPRMENALAQIKAEEEKSEVSGADKSQPKNEGTPPPPQPDPIPPKAEPAHFGHEDT